MEDADLSGADLSNANFTFVYLGGAVFKGTVLTGARFVDCGWEGTVLADVDLSAPEVLDVGVHERSSSVGFDTLLKSAGGNPLEDGVAEPLRSFLVACGVPESFLPPVRT